jgi:hypothetical protein
MRRTLLALAAVAILLVVAGCGSAKKKSHQAAAATGPLSGEAQSAATGDIPDNQAFLTYRDAGSGYSIQVPEGWARKGTGANVTFQDKNNVVQIVVDKGALPRPSTEAARLRPAHVGASQTLTIHGAKVLKVSYRTASAPNPVTGKRVQLVVDRYVYVKGGRRATVDLGTAKGVDNVDAYRMMSRSFTWR